MMVLIMRLCLVWLLASVPALATCAAMAASPAATPRYVIYYNADASPAEDLIGLPYTHVILSFVTLAEGGRDMELIVDPKLEESLKVVDRLKADGKKVLVSFGGGDMTMDAWRKAVGRETALASMLADFVSQRGLDGVDVDFEVTRALHHPPPQDGFDGKAFLIAFTHALRRSLHEGALIAHAPQAPYLDPDWHGGPYIAVLDQAGEAIDWITVQYYNNPDFELPIATHLVGADRNVFPASYAGIASGENFDWSSERTLVGLPVYRADASSGHHPPEVVRDQIVKPLMERYGDRFGGLTGWQFSTLTDDHRYWNGKLHEALRPAEQ